MAGIYTVPVEQQWVSRIHLAAEAAKASGARICFSSGFDSIPFDLGVLMLQKHAVDTHGSPAPRVRGRMRAMQGTFSGGTAASLGATMKKAATNPGIIGVLRDPFALTPGFEGPDQPSGMVPRYEEDLGNWSAPFIMAAINVRNVHRSNMLMGYAYGENFRYSEMMAAPNGPGAYIASAGLGALTGALAFPPTRALMKGAVLPKPGEGPNRQQRETGYYKVLFIAKIEGGETVSAIVKGDRDPGYGSTSKLIAESALHR